MKKILLVFGFLIFSITPTIQVQAAGCGYICNPSTTDNLAYCKANRGSNAYLGTNLSANGQASCTGQSTCPLGSIPVCCCTENTSIITPVNTNTTDCSWTEKENSSLNGSCPTTKNPCAESKCSGAKSNNQVCCGTPIMNAANTDPKFKLPDYIFQIPIGNLTKLQTVDCSSGVCKVPFIAQYISAAYGYGLSIAGVLAVLMLMAAGLLWLVSGGDSGKTTQAKKMIVGSVTGLLLLVGLTTFLSFINTDLTKNKSIELDVIQRQELDLLADSKLGAKAEEYKNKPCANSNELNTGTDFYATGYYKAPWKDNQNNYYLCDVHMQGTCPNGVNESGSCTENGKPIFKDYPNYKPCNQFSKEQYNSYFSASDLIVGKTIAGPRCSNLPKNTQVCFNNKTYTITDSGGGIQGKRIDILSASAADAMKNTGVGKLTIGACK